MSHKRGASTEDKRWDIAVDALLNCGTVFPLIGDFWAFVDGEITEDEFRKRIN